LAKESLEVNIESGSSTLLPTAMSPLVVDHHPSIEDVKTPVIFRGEAEQLLEFELIKAMSNFKHPLVAPSLLSTQQNNFLEKKAFEMHPEGNQSCSRQQKNKIKSQKPGVKLIQEMLSKNGYSLKRINN
jgi:hypothetical protein